MTGDPAIRNSEEGMRAIIIGVLLLGATTLVQVAIFLASGSVALLGDTVHNFGDALNSLPLLLVFLLSRRIADRRYTYGYGRAEDLAGVLIVLSIGFSAVYILWESIDRLLDPRPLTSLGWLAVAAIVGFIGNELVASIQIRAGRRMGSDALVANGYHARADGLTSLAVLAAAVGAWIGYPVVDPIIGVIIGVAILFITWGAAKSMWYRLMDAVDPETVEKAASIIEEHADVRSVSRLQMRWIGHRMQVEAVVTAEAGTEAARCSDIADHLRHHLYHEIPNLAETTIEVVPYSHDGGLMACEASHHRKPGADTGSR
jgi:cation diffusion facilitator family transporter